MKNSNSKGVAEGSQLPQQQQGGYGGSQLPPATARGLWGDRSSPSNHKVIFNDFGVHLWERVWRDCVIVSVICQLTTVADNKVTRDSCFPSLCSIDVSDTQQ